MNVRNLLIVNTFLAGISAIGLLLFPDAYVAPYDVKMDPSALMFARGFGSQLLALAVMWWLGRDLGAAGRRILAIGSAIGWVVWTISIVLAVTSGVTNTTGYFWVVLGTIMSLLMIGAVTGVGVREEV